MKFMGVLAVIMAAQASFAGLLDVSLNMNGEFKSTEKINVHYDRKTCAQERGRYMGHGNCLVNQGGGNVSISQISADSYAVKITNVRNNSHFCAYEGELTAINSVQLKGGTEECQVNVGFTDPNTVSVWTDGECREVCYQCGSFNA